MAGHQDVGYVRVSTVIQNTARQLEAVKLDKVFEDRATGSNTDRPQLKACVAHLRDGDTLHVHSMDRLCRNLDDLRRIVKELTSKGVKVTFHKEGLTFTGEDSPISNLLLSMLGGFVFLSHQVGSFMGAWLGGKLYDATGSYTLMWWIAVVLGVFAALINLPVRETPIHRPLARPA